MRQATLCFLVREVNGEKELLLAMKKKRFGVGKWNGVGGKLDFNKGEPKESKEMRPKWFKVDEIPFDEMWPDDEFWLPKVLNGKKVKAKFIFKPGELIDSYEIKTI